MKVAIQGIRGSNHHQVVKEYYSESVDLIECLSFDKLVAQVIDGTAHEGVMAIENSIAGSIIPNYNLIYHNGLHITGEYYLDIHHHLMTMKGQSLENIKEIHSHPMALLQCKDFFELYPHIRLVADVDTAITAKRIHEEQISHIAAVAPKVSAELYDLEIIAPSIQSSKNNETRFFFVSSSKIAQEIDNIDKASIRFITDHKRGSLATILNVMSDCNLNLTKIQSLPILETPWKYAFFVDVTFEQYKHFSKAKSLLELMSENFNILGEYKNVRS